LLSIFRNFLDNFSNKYLIKSDFLENQFIEEKVLPQWIRDALAAAQIPLNIYQ
jgi:hypothetical protein